MREHGAEIAGRLMQIVRDKRSALSSVQAARVMLDYGLPRPKQTVEVQERGPRNGTLELRKLWALPTATTGVTA